jgi:hypothetical protein
MALEDARDDDPIVGWPIGAQEVVCRLSPRHLLGLRPGGEFVVLERIEIEPAGMHDLQQHAELMAQLSHPNLARVHGCISADEGVFWLSEMVAGATLKEIRAACKKAGKSLPLGLVFATLHEVALALGELHQRKRSHGDLRDGNVMIGFSGCSKLVNPGVLDSVQRLPPDPITDVFRLSHLLYECLTGGSATGPAFAPPSSFNHALEKPVDDLMVRALGPDRGRRFKNGTDLAQAIKSAAGAFMWKPAQRAEFVTALFRKRHQRTEHVLFTASARLAELKAARDAEKAAVVAAEEHAKFMAQQDANTEQVDLDFAIEECAPVREVEPPVVYSVPRKLVLGGGAALLGIIGCVALVNVMSSNAAAASGAVVLAPPIPVLMPMPAPAPAPLPLPPANAVQLATAAEPAAADAVQAEAPPKAKKKKKSSADEGQLPPWLMRKGRR